MRLRHRAVLVRPESAFDEDQDRMHCPAEVLVAYLHRLASNVFLHSGYGDLDRPHQAVSLARTVGCSRRRGALLG